MTDPTDYVLVPREALDYRNLPMKIAIAMEVSFALSTTTKAKAEAIEKLLKDALLSAALSAPPPAREAVEARTWRCFHCDEVFTTPEAAQEHFGRDELCTPGCCIDLAEYRRMEEVHQAHLTETDDASKIYYAMRADHCVALVREEEKGYARGLADGRAEAREAGLREALEFYRDAWVWRGSEALPRARLMLDKGERARAALSQQQETG